MLRWRSTLATTVVAAVCVLVAACQFAPAEPAPTADDSTVDYGFDLAGVCESPRKYYTRVDPYTGDGPHPITAFRTSRTGDVVSPVNLGLEDRANAPLQWLNSDGARYQLVACLGRPEDGGLLYRCEFDAGDLPLHRGVYDRVTVYEAGTGKQVGVERMLGTGVEATCPTSAVTSSEDPRIFTVPNLAEFRSVLGKYVDQPVGGPTAPSSAEPVTDLTGLCAKLIPALPETFRSSPPREPISTPQHQYCDWRVGSDGPFEVDAVLHTGVGPRTGAESALDSLASYVANSRLFPTPEPLPGLGDKAVASKPFNMRGGVRLSVVVRNALITITWYDSDIPYDTAKEAAVVTARAAIATLPR